MLVVVCVHNTRHHRNHTLANLPITMTAGRKRIVLEAEIENMFRTPMIRLQRIKEERNTLRARVQEQNATIEALRTERQDLINNITRIVSENQVRQHVHLEAILASTSVSSTVSFCNVRFDLIPWC